MALSSGESVFLRNLYPLSKHHKCCWPEIVRRMDVRTAGSTSCPRRIRACVHDRIVQSGTCALDAYGLSGVAADGCLFFECDVFCRGTCCQYACPFFPFGHLLGCDEHDDHWLPDRGDDRNRKSPRGLVVGHGAYPVSCVYGLCDGLCRRRTAVVAASNASATPTPSRSSCPTSRRDASC